MHTINIVLSSFCHSSYVSVSSGFEEWIHLFVQDFGQKRETLPDAIVILLQVCN